MSIFMLSSGDLYSMILYPRNIFPISFLITSSCFFLITSRSIFNGSLLRLYSESYVRPSAFSISSSSIMLQNAGCHFVLFSISKFVSFLSLSDCSSIQSITQIAYWLQPVQKRFNLLTFPDFIYPIICPIP